MDVAAAPGAYKGEQLAVRSGRDEVLAGAQATLEYRRGRGRVRDRDRNHDGVVYGNGNRPVERLVDVGGELEEPVRSGWNDEGGGKDDRIGVRHGRDPYGSIGEDGRRHARDAFGLLDVLAEIDEVEDLVARERELLVDRRRDPSARRVDVARNRQGAGREELEGRAVVARRLDHALVRIRGDVIGGQRARRLGKTRVFTHQEVAAELPVEAVVHDREGNRVRIAVHEHADERRQVDLVGAFVVRSDRRDWPPQEGVHAAREDVWKQPHHLGN